MQPSSSPTSPPAHSLLGRDIEMGHRADHPGSQSGDLHPALSRRAAIGAAGRAPVSMITMLVSTAARSTAVGAQLRHRLAKARAAA